MFRRNKPSSPTPLMLTLLTIWQSISGLFRRVRRSLGVLTQKIFSTLKTPFRGQSKSTTASTKLNQSLMPWNLRPAQWQLWFNRSRLFLCAFFFTIISTGIIGLLTLPALAAVDLRIEPLTWDFVGLDSNKPATQGPNTYVVGARVCNVGSSPATDVDIEFFKDGIDSAYTFINLQGTELIEVPVIPAYNPSDSKSVNSSNYTFDTVANNNQIKTKYRIDYTPTNCFDAYYNFDVTRSPTAWHTTQRYYIEARAGGSPSVRTPRPRQIYIEQLISQARNSVLSFGCNTPSPTDSSTAPVVTVGDVFTCTATAYTATRYPQLSFTADFPNIIFQTLDVNTVYSDSGEVNSSVYADACGWVQDPTDPRYHKSSSQCVGEPNYVDQYIDGAVGNTITTTYTIKVLGTGNSDPNTVDVTNIILDNSGGSYHYNADLGTGLNLITITIRSAPLSDISVVKSHTGNFTPGANAYTVTITDSGDDRLAGGTTPTGESVPTKAPVVIRDDLPAGYTFNPTTPVTGGNSADWVCSLSNANTSIQCVYDVGRNGVYEDFPDNTTQTLTFNVNVDANTAGVNSVNTISINGNNDYNLDNNVDTDTTILVNAANLVLTKDDTDTDTTGFNPSETAPAPSPTIVAGQPITYDFTVANSSTTVTAAAPIILTDTLPTGLTYVSNTSPAGWSCAVEGQNITCTYSQNLAPSTSAPVLQIVANTNKSGVTSGTSATITNTATVTSPTTDANLVNNTSSDNFLLTLPVSDLTIDKTDFGSSIVITQSGQTFTGQDLIYEFKIKNNGVAATTGNIQIREQLPIAPPESATVRYFSHTGTGPDGSPITWSCTTGINPTTANACVSNVTTGDVTFTYTGSLAPGQVATLDLVVKGPNVNPTGLAALTNRVAVFNANDGTTQTKTDTEITPMVTGGSQQNLAVQKKLTRIGSPLAAFTGCSADGSGSAYAYNLDSTAGGSLSDNNVPNQNFVEVCNNGLAPGTPVEYTVWIGNLNSAGSNVEKLQLRDFVPPEIDVTNITCQLYGNLSQGPNNSDCDATNAGGTGGTAGVQGTPTAITVTATVDPLTNLYTVNQFLDLAKGGGGARYVFTGTVKTAAQLQALTTVNSSIINRANVPLDNGTNADTEPLNNTAKTSISLDATNVAITKTDTNFPEDPGSASFVVGAEGSYVLRVQNVDATRSTVSDINVFDDLPSSFEFLYATGTNWTCVLADTVNNVVSCGRPASFPLAAGATSDITIVVRPLAGTTPGNFINLARVITAGDRTLTNNGNAPITAFNGRCATDCATEVTNNSLNTTFGYEQTPVIAQNVDLAITKLTSGTFTVGQTAAYNLSIVNRGPTVAIASAADPIIVTDILPQGLTFQSAVGAGWSCSATSVSGGTRDKVRCLRETNMAVNSPSTIALNVFVDGDVASSITNTAYVDAAPADFTGDDAGLGADSVRNAAETTGYSTDVNNATSRNRHSVTTAVTLASDLSIKKIATTQTSQIDPPQFVAGATGTFNLTVTNNGPSNYDGEVTFTDALPSGLTYNTSDGGDGFICSGTTTVTCTISDNNAAADIQYELAAGESKTVVVTVDVGTGVSGDLTNTASLDPTNTLTPANDPIGDTNDSDSETVNIASNTATLSITKDDDDGDRDVIDPNASDATRFITGGQGSYFLIVTNNGPAIAQQPVRIFEDASISGSNLPSGFTYQGYEPTPNWACTGTIGGSSFVCTYSSCVDGGDAGSVIGDDPVNECTAINMPVGRTSGLELIVGIDDNPALVGPIVNTVSADASNATTVTDDEPTLIVVPADLAVTKSGIDTIDAAPGTTGNYTITLTNNGPGAAEPEIFLTDYLPNGLSYVSFNSTDTNWQLVSQNNAANEVTFKYIGTLAANSSTSFDITVQVDANAPSIVRNFVRVSSLTTPESDNPDDAACDRDFDNFDGTGSFGTQPVNNCAVKETTITGGLETTLLKKHPAGDNGTINDVDISGSGFSTTFNYTIEVANTNTTDVPTVIIEDTLPETLQLNTTSPLSVSISAPDADVSSGIAGREFTRVCSYDSDTRLLSCNLGTVDPSETVAITLTVRPTTSGILTNTAGYLSGGSNTDDESVNIINPPDANTISGTVFQDAGKDGGTYILNTDVPVENIRVNLYRDNNNNGVIDTNDALLASTDSAADGSYSFETQLTGNFVVAVDTADADLPGTQTFTTATIFDATLGTEDTQNDFGYSIPAGNVLFVKRITAINTANQAGFNNDTASAKAAEDDNAGWPSPASTYLRGAIDGVDVAPGDEVEYTVYFLSSGGSPVRDVKFCDLIPANTTYLDGSIQLGYDTGTLANPSGSGTILTDTDVNDDGGIFYLADGSRGTAPSICTNANANGGNDSNPATNDTGAVFVQIVNASTNMPNATGAGTPAGSYGFVRFRVTVD